MSIVFILISVAIFAISILVQSIGIIGIGVGICFLAWGLKDIIPYFDGDSDYVDRLIESHESARINTRVYRRNVYNHSGQIKIVKDKIDSRK